MSQPAKSSSLSGVEKDGTMQTRNCGDYTHIMRGLRRHCASLARQETIDVARCPCFDHHRPLKTNESCR